MIPADPERLRIVAHELRSPVAALAALAEAASGVRDRDLFERLVGLALAAAHDVERLVGDPELVSLRPEVVDVVELAGAFESPWVTVAAGESSGLVRADPTRLRQALSNLVANGLRHGSSVALDVDEHDGMVVVCVTDDGLGFSEGIDPFARGTSSAGSTGYGLWLARRIAVAHGGTLDLDVEHAGDGARLRLCLPSASVVR